MLPKHTRGPWTVAPSFSIGSSGTHVCTVSSAVEVTAPTVDANDRPDDERLDADAALIAAAPTLLEAANALLDALETCDLHEDAAKAHDALCEAIAKAEGK